MKRKSIGLVLLCSLLTMACAQSKKTTTSSASASAKSGVADVPQLTAVQMSRSACFGRCPVYSVTVEKDGMVRFYGKHYNQYQGVYEKNVGAKQVATLFSQFEAKRVDTCSARYERLISDVPGINYSFTYAKKEASIIQNAHFGPQYLKELALSVDSLAKVDASWKKVADTVLDNR